MTLKESLAVLVSQPTVSVPFAGEVLGEMTKNASYDAAVGHRLGVEVLEVRKEAVLKHRDLAQARLRQRADRAFA